MKAWIPTLGAVACLMASLPAAAQFKNADDAINYRQGVMTVMSNHAGRIGLMASNRVPFDARAVQINADLVATLARLPWAAFIDGSERGDTSAKAEIWSQADKFKAEALKLQDTSAKLAEVAKTGNQDAIKTAFGNVSEACKTCHDDFRKKR